MGHFSCVTFNKVGKPRIGENRPSRVRADVTISVGMKDTVRNEWEGNNIN